VSKRFAVAEVEADVNCGKLPSPISTSRGWSRKCIWTWRTWDRAVREYAQEICRVNPVPVKPL